MEDVVDTLVLVVTSGTLELDHLTIFSTNSEVILQRENDLLMSEAKLSNPVEDGQLSIDLNGAVAGLELISMQGEVVRSFQVNGNIELPVNDLVAGVYILRDSKSTSFRKILIK